MASQQNPEFASGSDIRKVLMLTMQVMMSFTIFFFWKASFYLDLEISSLIHYCVTVEVSSTNVATQLLG